MTDEIEALLACTRDVPNCKPTHNCNDAGKP